MSPEFDRLGEDLGREVHDPRVHTLYKLARELTKLYGHAVAWYTATNRDRHVVFREVMTEIASPIAKLYSELAHVAEKQRPMTGAEFIAAFRKAAPNAFDDLDAVLGEVTGGEHLVDGEFQSDKYPTCPAGKVPLSTKDPAAQDLLWEYAERRRQVDREFSDDLQLALRLKGFDPAERARLLAAVENRNRATVARQLVEAVLDILQKQKLGDDALCYGIGWLYGVVHTSKGLTLAEKRAVLEGMIDRIDHA